jgi:hypothetical protein
MVNGIRIVVGLVALMSGAGCAYSIKDVDISRVQPDCARQCTVTYSSCIQTGPIIGSKMETLRACHDAYAVCIQTCPAT